MDGAIDFGDVTAHDEAGLFGPGSFAGGQGFGAVEAALEKLMGGFDFVGGPDFVVLKGVADGVVVDLDVGPVVAGGAGGGGAEGIEGVAEVREGLVEFGAVFGGDFDAGWGDGADFVSDVVGGAVGADGEDEEEGEEELAHGGMKLGGGARDKPEDRVPAVRFHEQARKAMLNGLARQLTLADGTTFDAGGECALAKAAGRQGLGQAEPGRRTADLFDARLVFPELRLRLQGVEGGVENALERFWQGLQLVVLPLAIATRFNEACPAQIGKMPGDARLIGIQSAVEEANANFAFAHEIEQTKPVHIRESGKKEGGLVVHAFHIRLDESDFKREFAFVLANVTNGGL